MYAGFPSGMFPKVCCPKDQGPLVYEGHKKFIREGEVRCVSCGYAYPIREGILNLVSAQPAFDEIAAANMAARDQEAPIYDSTGHTPLRIACELKAMLRELDPIEGKEILDVGCGTGSFALELLPRAGSVMGMDFSTQSLAVFAAKIDREENVGLVSADARRLVLSPESFDAVLSSWVLQDVPDRTSLLENMRFTLRPRGTFVATAYHYSVDLRLRGHPRDGFDASGVFFHRFTADELAEEVRGTFGNSSARPILLPLWRLPQWLRPWDALERVPLIRRFGRTVLVCASKTAGTPEAGLTNSAA